MKTGDNAAMYYTSIALAVAGGLLYHIAQKSTPRAADPYASLAVSYLVSILICLGAFAYFGKGAGAIASLKQLNWVSLVLGVAIFAIEIGFLLAYRAGWNLNNASVTANVAVAVLVVPAGAAIFEEHLQARSALGILFCIVGLFLLLRR
jgi:uncharacterized membrane protein